jgi:phospholipid/cholesterol/gamma-HCH transport system substrate-binding protein
MRFRVGLFVLAALVLLAVFIFLFGGLPTLFKAHDQYTVVLPDAAGVAPGTPVRRSGVRIGEVRSLALDDGSGKVRVEILVDKKHPPRQGDQAVLVRGLLDGDTSIEFVPPEAGGQPAERKPVPPGTEFAGQGAPGVRAVIRRTSDLIPPAQETLTGVQKALQDLDRLAPQMEAAIQEYRDLARATRDLVPELRRTNDEVRGLAKASRESVPDFRRTNDQIQTAARNWARLGERLDGLVQTNQDKLVKALDSFTDTVVRVGGIFSDENQGNIAATLKNVRAGSEHLDSIGKNTDALVQESRTTIGRMRDLFGRADEVLTNLQQASRPWAERSGSVMKNLDEGSSRFSALMTDLSAAFRCFSRTDGTLGRLLNDPALYNNLDAAACMIVRILPAMERAVHDLEIVADKIARHPESLGLGGIISPSSGLKDVPSDWPHH